MREMEDIAWIPRSDSSEKNGIGLVPAKDIKPLEQHMLSEE